MGEHYNHFTLEERCRLRGLLEQGLGPAAIARRLGRHRATINREIARNRCVAGGYRPESAQHRAWARIRARSEITTSGFTPISPTFLILVSLSLR